jgi:tetratricopeptide (TPR) repeat protein
MKLFNPLFLGFFLIFACGPTGTGEVAVTNEKVPVTADDWYELGVNSVNLEDFGAAIQQFTLAIEADSLFASAFHDRGIAHFELGFLDKAEADFLETIALEPERGEAYFNLALVYHDGEQLNEAAQYYTLAIEKMPEISEAYFNRAFILMELNRKEEACNDFRMASKLGDPDADEAVKKLCGNL